MILSFSLVERFCRHVRSLSGSRQFLDATHSRPLGGRCNWQPDDQHHNFNAQINESTR